MHNGDVYGGYNKPEAVREWLDHVEPESDTVHFCWQRLMLHAYCPRQCAIDDLLQSPPHQALASHHAHTTQAQVLILDTDLIIRAPFLPTPLHVRHGFARSAEFGYMKGAARPAHAPLPDPWSCAPLSPSGAQLRWTCVRIMTPCAGVNNDLALRHIPEVAPKHNTLAGPFGRRSDQVIVEETCSSLKGCWGAHAETDYGACAATCTC